MSFEKFGGIWKFGTLMSSGKIGTFENFGAHIRRCLRHSQHYNCDIRKSYHVDPDINNHIKSQIQNHSNKYANLQSR